MTTRALNANQLVHALRQRRKELGFTQQQVAQRSGLLPKTVSALENQPGKCKISTLLKLLMELDLNLGLLDKVSAPPTTDVEW